MSVRTLATVSFVEHILLYTAPFRIFYRQEVRASALGAVQSNRRGRQKGVGDRNRYNFRHLLRARGYIDFGGIPP